MTAATVREAPARYGGLDRGPARVDRRDDGRACGDRQPAASQQPSFSEADLSVLWSGQRFPASALVTRDGVPVRVLHPGRGGRGAGPDFRDAVITTPSGALLRGDVELHVRASDFRAHGHHRDRRYDGVVLHVVFEDDATEGIRLASGRRPPLVALAPWVRRRAEELAGWLAGPGLWREPCHDAIPRLGREAVRRTLETLGDRRFGEREAALAAAMGARGLEEALYRALLAGLGYGGDRRLLEQVADHLPWRELAARLAAAPAEDRAVLAEALLLGAVGLLPSQNGAGPGHPRESRWEEDWRDGRGEVTRMEPCPAAGYAPSGRPANGPARRLAGLAQLLLRHGFRHEGGPSVEEGHASRLIEGWTVTAEGYWREHIAPGVAAGRPVGSPIGRGRAIELLVNAVLPLTAARSEALGRLEDAARARASFARLPRPGRYGSLAFLEANLRAGAEPVVLDARRQQGLLALYKAECTQGGCGRCPLS